MPRSLKLLLAACCLAAVRPALAATAFDSRDVPADARWVVYADLATLRPSRVGGQLLPLLNQLVPVFESTNPVVRRLVGLVDSVTAHGTTLSNRSSGDGVLLIRAQAKFRQTLEFALEQIADRPEPNVFARPGFSCPAFAVKSKPGAEKEARATDPDLIILFPPEPVVLMGKSPARLKAALELLQQRGARADQQTAAPLHRFLAPADGTYFFAATGAPPREVPALEGAPAGLVATAIAGSIALGEKGPNTLARLDFLAPSSRDARALEDSLQGIAMLAATSEITPKSVIALLQQAKITRNSEVITIRATEATAVLAPLVQARPAPSPAAVAANRHP